MNRTMQKFGRLAKGIKKHYTPQERARRADIMRLNQAKRWPGKANPSPNVQSISPHNQNAL